MRKVIRKGKFPLSESNGLLSLFQFLFVEEDGQKFLLLKLSNDGDEEVTGVTLEITQKDNDGKTLSVRTDTYSVLNGRPRTRFVLDHRISIVNTCEDVAVRIVSARFGNYEYSAYSKMFVTNTSSLLKAARSTRITSAEKGLTVSLRGLRLPLAVCIVILAALAAAILLTYGQLRKHMSETDTFYYGNVAYRFAENDKSQYSGVYAVGTARKAKEIVIPEKIQGHTVIGIAENGFQNSNIEKLTIQAPIPITEYMFSHSMALKEINLEKVTAIGKYAFLNCHNLTTVNAANLRAIGENAFAFCSSLKTVSISNSEAVLTIGSYAFAGCKQLTRVDIDQFIDYADNAVFFPHSMKIEYLHLKNINHTYEFNGIVYKDGRDRTIADLFGIEYTNGSSIRAIQNLEIDSCDTIPENFCYRLPLKSVSIKNLRLGEVGNNAFSDCIRLVQLDVPIPLTRIGDRAFYGTGIFGLDGSCLEYIGDEAFYACANLSQFSLEENETLSYIGDSAFYGCYKIKSFVIPKSVHSIEDKTFQGCRELSEFSFGNILTIGNEAFLGCSRLTSVSIPDTVQKIAFGAFSQCHSLREMRLPFIGGSLEKDGLIEDKYLAYIFGGATPLAFDVIPEELHKVTIAAANTIEEKAFYHCDSLKEIVIESDFSKIGAMAFFACKSLTEFVIPASVSQIDAEAFAACYRLHELYNLSKLQIARRTAMYGKAGYYALKIYTSREEPKIPCVAYDGYEFKRADDQMWYLTGYAGSGGALILPEKIDYRDERITSYTVNQYCMLDDRSIQSVRVSAAVTAIGDYAFQNCPTLQNVFIPDSVVSIGLGAFSGCDGLQKMVLPFIGNTSDDNRFINYIFGSQSSNAGVAPASLSIVTVSQASDIPAYAFAGCTGLVTVNLPAYKRIGEGAFYNCASLSGLVLPDNLLSIGKNAFYNCSALKTMKIPMSVSSIGFGAFTLCNNLESITIPFVGGTPDSDRYFAFIFGAENADTAATVPYSLEYVTLTKGVDIPDQAFYRCYNVVSFTLPDGLESIGAEAFSYCFSLKKLDLPDTLEIVNNSAFYNCSSLEQVTLRSAVQIKEQAFLGCTALYAVYDLGGMNIRAGSTENGYIAYYAVAVFNTLQEALEEVNIDGIVFKHYKDIWAIVGYVGSASELNLTAFSYQGITISSYAIKIGAFRNNSIIHLTIGKEVASLEAEAFNYGGRLKTVNMSESVLTEISSNVFRGCAELETVSLPRKLERIENSGFFNCRKLYTIAIPETVTEIGNQAFYGCYALSDVYNLSKTLSVRKGAADNGYVGFYALRVNTAADIAPLDMVVSSGNRFIRFDGRWYMISLSVEYALLSLPESIFFNGTFIESYTVMEYALAGQRFTRIYVPKIVDKIQRSASYQYTLYVDSISYGGSEQEWKDCVDPASPLAKAEVYYNRPGL